MPFGPVRDLGPALVDWGETTIAEIWDEIRWTLTGESAEVFEMLYGATPVDNIFLGYSACMITVPATRVALSVLATVLPGGTNSGGNSGAVEMIVAGSGAEVGRSMYENGLPLLVKPIVDGNAVPNGKWLRLEHAYPVPNFDVVFNLRDQRVYGLDFKACPDATTKQLWSIGKVAVTNLTGY